ncbi:MAG TPA: transglutaminase family protein [Dokdonella sp.]
MSIHVALNHVTCYRYDRPVRLGPQVVRLRPAPHSRTRILAYSMSIVPAEYFINWQQDPQANYLARLTIPEPTREFRVEVDLVAEMAVLNPFDFFLEPGAEQFPFAYEPALAHELAPYLAVLPPTPRFAEYLAAIPREACATADFLVALNQRLSRDIGYLIRMEPGVQTPEYTLTKASGSCRDSAWLLVQLLRGLGLAARFVSGYLIQLVADVKALDGPSGPERDFTDLHAWCEVYLPGAGWIGLDPTSGLLAGEGHIPLACSPEPGSAAPISGAVESCEVTFEHTMSVRRILETPRVTQPYREQAWAAIVALGREVDADLEHLDVRLTMGGEPTFVAADDPEGAEWNTAALGPTKRKRAIDVFDALRSKYAPYGLVHFGQGKWYPGEQLPRWSLNCHWRNDGEPIWREHALIADERRDHGADAARCGRFLRELASRLGVGATRVFAAHEDAAYYLWREQRLPANVDAADSRLRDPLERERLQRVFAHDLGDAVGYVLPLAREEEHWRSSAWPLRGGTCLLVPGDSPIGYRLPLDSLPWAEPDEQTVLHERDPAQPLPPLPAYSAPALIAAASPEQERAPQPGESPSRITRTALCAQARGGTLYLFMPPLERAEDYLELVAAIEATAAALATPVLLEGYEPPRDARLSVFRVTPDPGVIEVNIHPAARWDELVERTTHLYETAHAARLSAEKFMIDGRHVGTGGGNHFVLGGKTPNDSPFLRRPDLLRSLLSYWLAHPSLSYLFSGLFIGPTSQAPRVDEARNDSLYELELAFQQFPAAREEVAPWLIDRLLRNLLIDVTGNTHRTEFCIDKLFSPDGPAGRLGLVELRAFEMPPHAQMSLVQQLLLRALVARFWREPFALSRLPRWGSQLHDRFLLPHFVAQDFAEVIAETRDAGYALDPAWFAPHLEFRFPKLGDLAVAGIELELRHALEPWHVMGEEGSAGGAVRYVDSSLERVQVKLSGLAPDRYTLACNGRRVPLRSTGTAGEYVAGVRYRAWQPASALHPLIGVHAPLTFDLVDTWSGRAIAGCQYHVAHPGGRNYATFPVNAFEAESRRLARFFRSGHTPGPLDPVPGEGAGEFAFTLDLRRR